jgi:hypothetical protein
MFVSANTADIVATSNWSRDYGSSKNPTPSPDPQTPKPDGTFQYLVVPFNKDNILNDGASLVANPADKTASPKGWHNAPKNGQVDSRGNNVKASVDSSSGKSYFAASTGGSVFNYKYDLKKDPGSSKDAAITNVFHLSNRYHDVLYHYGFTEAAGNFQVRGSYIPIKFLYDINSLIYLYS